MKEIQWRKDNLFKKLCSNNWPYLCKEVNVDPDHTSDTKKKKKRIIELNVKCTLIKQTKTPIRTHMRISL